MYNNNAIRLVGQPFIGGETLFTADFVDRQDVR